MKIKDITWVVAGCLLLASCSTQKTANEPGRCGSLVGSVVGPGTIETAEPVRTGDQLVGLFTRVFLRFAIPDLPPITAPTNFCRATAKLQANRNSSITVQVWLPDEWNGKMVGTGGGGTNGGLMGASLSLQPPVERGYATFATDAGHETSNSAEFAYESQAQYQDWADRANHVAAEYVKDLITQYYGRAASQSYFHGCSNGGRDALVLAQRYPSTYDAIIAGAPAAHWSELTASFMWYAQTLHGEGVGKPLGKKLELIHNAILGQCDALDGVADGLLENPLQCEFDPEVLLCRAGKRKDCLTADEVAALQQIYGGPVLADGTQVYPGMPVGGEIQKHWEQWFLSTKRGGTQIAEQVFRWMVHRDTDWSWDQFDIERDYPLAQERMGTVVDADNPDISAFIDSGGKLLMYHGWNDAAIPATATINYVNAVQASLGSSSEHAVRLFMAPGVGHCVGGEAPHDFDMLDALDQWVQSDAPPERILARQYDPPKMFAVPRGAEVVRTRPLCAWPNVAQYVGSGSVDIAENFVCR